jgi:hypothetical protein
MVSMNGSPHGDFNPEDTLPTPGKELGGMGVVWPVPNQTVFPSQAIGTCGHYGIVPCRDD